MQNPADISLISRQPIYDANRNLFAYELLYRNQRDTSESLCGDESTAEVLRTFMEVGLDRIVGNSPAFVNMTRSFILGDYRSLLPRDRVVLEVLESVTPDKAVIDALTKLRAEGYRIALDDFTYSPDKAPMLELAHFVKIDFRMFSEDRIAEQLDHLKPYKARLLAEKIETHEEFEMARRWGFDYFQGFFLCQPRTLKTGRIPMNRLSTLRLIFRLREENLGTKDLENLIQQDIAVSHSLLRYVNSALISLQVPIQSIAHAVQMVGRTQIRTWSSLLLLSAFEEKPRELIVTALVRAIMSEHLATAMGEKNPESYFTAGLFSVLDALLDLPMNEAIGMLPLSESIRGAILNHEGTMGTVLKCVLAYEAGAFEEARCGDLSPDVLRNCYLESIAAARDLTTFQS